MIYICDSSRDHQNSEKKNNKYVDTSEISCIFGIEIDVSNINIEKWWFSSGCTRRLKKITYNFGQFQKNEMRVRRIWKKSKYIEYIAEVIFSKMQISIMVFYTVSGFYYCDRLKKTSR